MGVGVGAGVEAGLGVMEKGLELSSWQCQNSANKAPSLNGSQVMLIRPLFGGNYPLWA